MCLYPSVTPYKRGERTRNFRLFAPPTGPSWVVVWVRTRPGPTLGYVIPSSVASGPDRADLLSQVRQDGPQSGSDWESPRGFHDRQICPTGWGPTDHRYTSLTTKTDTVRDLVGPGSSVPAGFSRSEETRYTSSVGVYTCGHRPNGPH